MKSEVLPSFWATYETLDQTMRRRARKAFELWRDNPFHPSLHFKCINAQENIWSVRINRNFRALGIWEGDMLTWYWIGSHHDYERFIA
jgi:hypothetical protein